MTEIEHRSDSELTKDTISNPHNQQDLVSLCNTDWFQTDFRS